MAFGGFPKETVRFLAGLQKNNDKKWFDAHRADYEAYYVAPAEALVGALLPRLRKLDPSIQGEPKVGGSIMRIFRDVRFSKDKAPYKDHLDVWFWTGEEKGWDCSGFFLRLTAETLMLGAGMHCFTPPMLARYREAVLDAKKGPALVKAVAKVREAGYEVGGESYKKTPKGVAPDHPRASLLKHGALHSGWEGRHPAELFTADLPEFMVDHWKAVRPIHAWLTAM